MALNGPKEVPGRIHPIVRITSLPIDLMGSRDTAITLCASYVDDEPGHGPQQARMFTHTLATQSPQLYTIGEEKQGISIGGQKFDMIAMKINMGKNGLRQAVYTTMLKGYALDISVVSLSDAGLKKSQDVLNSFRFDRPD